MVNSYHFSLFAGKIGFLVILQKNQKVNKLYLINYEKTKRKLGILQEMLDLLVPYFVASLYFLCKFFDDSVNIV